LQQGWVGAFRFRSEPLKRADERVTADGMAMNHILVATDLTDRSERALARALQLTSQSGRLTLLHVVTAGLPEDVRAEQQRIAADFVTRRLQGVPVAQRANCESVLATGCIFSTIIAEAVGRNAELIVLGKAGIHPYAELFTGTTAERVVRFSDRPVLTVKQPPNGPYRRILSAFDGSEGAIRALRMALLLAPEAEVRVVHAWRPPQVALGEIEAARKAIEEENERLRAQIREAAEQATVHSASQAKVTIDLVENNPYLVIANESSSADLLVMGTHSKGRLASTATIGGLARHLLAESSIDVLTSRP
jgi:nucleotide-binding universal stress UspA family protein